MLLDTGPVAAVHVCGKWHPPWAGHNVCCCAPSSGQRGALTGVAGAPCLRLRAERRHRSRHARLARSKLKDAFLCAPSRGAGGTVSVCHLFSFRLGGEAHSTRCCPRAQPPTACLGGICAARAHRARRCVPLRTMPWGCVAHWLLRSAAVWPQRTRVGRLGTPFASAFAPTVPIDGHGPVRRKPARVFRNRTSITR